MNFVGKGTRLGANDIATAAASIGVSEAALRAVITVETSGSGFDSHGRPKALYEPQYFYRLCPKDRLIEAVGAGLAYKVAGSKPYPSDSYPRIIAACAIDEDAALSSASFGLGQIMGSNHAVAGYASAKEMVLAFMDSEAAQLSGMVGFIKHNRLDVALRNLDWVAFSKGYNGSNYHRLSYDTKLAAAYDRASRTASTTIAKPVQAVSAPIPTPVAPVSQTAPAATVSAPAPFSFWSFLKALFRRS